MTSEQVIGLALIALGLGGLIAANLVRRHDRRLARQDARRRHPSSVTRAPMSDREARYHGDDSWGR